MAIHSNWHQAGKQITGKYMGIFPYSGQIVDSRVKYGGNVEHTVQLDEPISVYNDTRERILVNMKDQEHFTIQQF